MNISEIDKQRLKKRAQEIADLNGGMSWQCYQQAHAEYLMALIEGDNLTRGEKSVLAHLRSLSTNGRPVRTEQIAAALGGWHRVEVWRKLNSLELKGLVKRLDNRPKGGWLLM